MKIQNSKPLKTLLENFNKRLSIGEKIAVGIGGLLLIKFLPLWLMVGLGAGGAGLFCTDTGKKILNDMGSKVNKNNKTLK